MAKDLSSLHSFVARRFPKQPDAVDVMPPADVRLGILKTSLVVGEKEMPKVLRRDFADHLRKLKVQLNGKPELLLVHALAISYLRRDTPHTEKALVLFHRIWKSEREFLIKHLPLRWMISALQTFHDRGETEGQKMIGAVGFMYANMIKVYEAERSTMCQKKEGQMSSDGWRCEGFPGMGSFRPGDDILRNINAMALVVSRRDPIAGAILEEVMLKTSRNDTIFRRVDALRERGVYAELPKFYGSFGDLI